MTPMYVTVNGMRYKLVPAPTPEQVAAMRKANEEFFKNM